MHGNALAKITLCVFVWLWRASLFASSSTLATGGRPIPFGIVTLIIEATGREFIIDVGQTAKRTQVNC